MGAVLLLLVIDAAFVVFTARSSLTSARTDLERAVDDFRAGRFASAEEALDAARASAARVAGLDWHPAELVATVLPWVRDDARAVQQLADAAVYSSDGGREAVLAVRSARKGSDKLSDAIYHDGEIDFDAIDRAAPHLRLAHSALEGARRALGLAPSAHLGSVADALADGRDRVDDALRSVSRAGVLLHALPDLLGRSAAANYFLAFQSPSEERATGGLLGFYGVLHIDGGRVSLANVAPIARLEARLPGPVSGPAWYEHEYGGFGALEQWRQAAFSPDFPTVSQVLLHMYAKTTARKLDGVIAMDPYALARMMEATDPITSGGRVLTSENVEAFLLHDSYELRQREQRPIIRDVITQFWSQLSSGDVDGPALVRGMSDAIATRHLQVYSAHRDSERSLASLDADGSLDAYGPNVQLVYHNALGANKVDYFLHRDISTTIDVAASGDLDVTTNVSMRNDAPSGPPSILLGGLGANARPGESQMAFDILMPRRATFSHFSEKGRRYYPLKGSDDGRPRVWDVIFIRPGGSYDLGVQYTVPHAVALDSTSAHLSFAFIPQAMVNPDSLDLRIDPPPGYSIATDDPRVEARGDALTAHVALDRPLALDLVLSKND